MTDSALALAHQEIVDRLREKVDEALRCCEVGLVPVLLPHALMDALRECDRLEGIKRDWEQAMDDCLAREANPAEEVGC